jgi:hypothetical protein
MPRADVCLCLFLCACLCLFLHVCLYLCSCLCAQGLGNQFLDDLRHADALIHVVDVSGTTNAKGEATLGYDPINDIDWLRSEIFTYVRAPPLRQTGALGQRECAWRVQGVGTGS